eukprot:7715128-Pyramimonas_sp.AAC.2
MGALCLQSYDGCNMRARCSPGGAFGGGSAHQPQGDMTGGVTLLDHSAAKGHLPEAAVGLGELDVVYGDLLLGCRLVVLPGGRRGALEAFTRVRVRGGGGLGAAGSERLDRLLLVEVAQHLCKHKQSTRHTKREH